ncbi:MAG: tetratricopeptide repeat protein [Fimbriimonas sp.]
MRAIWVGVLLLMSALGFAQKAPAADRTSLIWEYAGERMARQIDIWFDEGDFPRCVQLLRVQFIQDPTDYDNATNLGWMLENIERDDEAIAIYIRFNQANPKDPDRSFPEADYYFRNKAYAKVPPLLEPVLKSKPQPNAFRILAHSYERLNQLKDSKRVWQTYIGLVPSDGAAKRNLERVERKLKGA